MADSIKYATHIVNRCFDAQPTTPDGNCLFESVSLILQKNLNIRKSIEQLRWMVARRFLHLYDTAATSVLLSWIVLANQFMNEQQDIKDEQSWREYSHILSMPGREKVKTEKDITNEMRFYVYDQIMKATFWGETFSLDTLAHEYNIQFHILDGSSIPLVKMQNRHVFSLDQFYKFLQPFLLACSTLERRDETIDAWIYLGGKHYTPLWPIVN